ncbi:MAG: DUF6049 family protein [Acidimicrobiales bacterium]
MSTRWARTALCTLALAAATLLSTAAVAASPAGAAVRAGAGAPPLTLSSQTPWVTPTAPWFTTNLAVGEGSVAAADLHVSLTFYSRVADASQFQQAVGAVPQKSVLLRVPDVPVTENGAARVATACVTVLPDSSATAPAGSTGACPSGDTTTLVLDCTPDTGVCGDVYPVSVALLRQGDATPVARFTTFLTYQEPDGPVGADGPLRVGLVAPVLGTSAPAMAGALAAHRDVPVSLAVSPRTATALAATHTRGGTHALEQLAGLSGDEVLVEPYVPVNLAALSEAGIAGEIQAQIDRGTQLLHQAGLHPESGLWVDTASSFSQGDAGNLASGLQVAGAGQLVLNDGDLASAGSSSLTFAQPFTLDLGNGTDPAAMVSDSNLGALFTASPGDPVLGAQQLLAGLSFVHFENTFEPDARGVVVSPPSSWRPNAAFMDTLLAGLSGNPVLKATTLSDLMSQVPAGGNREPTTRRLQAGPAGRSISRAAGQKIAVSRQQLTSYSSAVSGHPPVLVGLGDLLLSTESQRLGAGGRTSALGAFDRAFAGETGKITLATERTVTFTSQRAPIPITVLSSAPYAVRVVVTLNSDKFTFPDGNTQPLTLDRPTTSVRVTAQARTSGDRLPIDVTLHTPDGQLLIAHTVLTVQSTEISFVGVALTVLAGAVLLVWWVRTWRRSRRTRPRAH